MQLKKKAPPEAASTTITAAKKNNDTTTTSSNKSTAPQPTKDNTDPPSPVKLRPNADEIKMRPRTTHILGGRPAAAAKIGGRLATAPTAVSGAAVNTTPPKKKLYPDLDTAVSGAAVNTTPAMKKIYPDLDKRVYRQSNRIARTLYPCEGENPDELSFEKGEYLFRVMASDEPGWVRASLRNGETGVVPVKYIEFM